LDQSIGIDETNTFQLKFLFYHQNCGSHSFGRFVGVRVGVANFFLGQSIGIDESNTFHLKLVQTFSIIKTVGATVLGGLWALEWAWHIARNLHAKSQKPSSYSFRDLSVHPDRQTDGHG